MLKNQSFNLFERAMRQRQLFIEERAREILVDEITPECWLISVPDPLQSCLYTLSCWWWRQRRLQRRVRRDGSARIFFIYLQFLTAIGAFSMKKDWSHWTTFSQLLASPLVYWFSHSCLGFELELGYALYNACRLQAKSSTILDCSLSLQICSQRRDVGWFIWSSQFAGNSHQE